MLNQGERRSALSLFLEVRMELIVRGVPRRRRRVGLLGKFLKELDVELFVGAALREEFHGAFGGSLHAHIRAGLVDRGFPRRRVHLGRVLFVQV